ERVVEVLLQLGGPVDDELLALFLVQVGHDVLDSGGGPAHPEVVGEYGAAARGLDVESPDAFLVVTGVGEHHPAEGTAGLGGDDLGFGVPDTADERRPGDDLLAAVVFPAEDRANCARLTGNPLATPAFGAPFGAAGQVADHGVDLVGSGRDRYVGAEFEKR